MLRFCFALGFACFFCLSGAEARIGESKSTIERRLMASGGVIYRDDAIKQARQRGKPYPSMIQYLSGKADVRIYFKTSDGRSPSSSELNARRMTPGWDLHVVYVDGNSVLELYERSQGMTGYEANQLLALQTGDSYWKRVAKGEKKEPTVFGYEMIREDGAIRARKLGGNVMLFVDSEIDTELSKAREADQIEKAPLSIEGF